MATKIVTNTVNKVTFTVDNNSYTQALRKIRSVKSEFEKANLSSLKGLKTQEYLNKIKLQQAKIEKIQADTAARHVQIEKARISKEMALERQASAQRVSLARKEAAQIESVERSARRIRSVSSLNPWSGYGIKSRTKPSSETRSTSDLEHRAWMLDEWGMMQRTLVARYGDDFAKKLGPRFNILDASVHSAAGDGVTNLKGFKNELKALEIEYKNQRRNVSSVNESLSSFRHGLVGATAAFIAYSGIKTIVANATWAQGQHAQLMMTSDSPQQANDRAKWLHQTIWELGAPLKQASSGFVQMASSNHGQISEDSLRGLFKGYSAMATVLHTSPRHYQGGIYALQEMLSEGVVNSKLLRYQLAVHIPGAMGIFLQAARKAYHNNSLTQDQFTAMIKSGDVLAKDILPAVGQAFEDAAKKGGALQYAEAKLQAEQNRLSMAWTDFTSRVSESSSLTKELTNDFHEIADALEGNRAASSAFGEALAGFLHVIYLGVAHVYNTLVLLEVAFIHVGHALGATNKDLKNLAYIIGELAAIVTVAMGFKMFAGSLRMVARFAAPLLRIFGKGGLAKVATTAEATVATTASSMLPEAFSLGGLLAAGKFGLKRVLGFASKAFWPAYLFKTLTDSLVDKRTNADGTNYHLSNLLQGAGTGALAAFMASGGLLDLPISLPAALLGAGGGAIWSSGILDKWLGGMGKGNAIPYTTNGYNYPQTPAQAIITLKMDGNLADFVQTEIYKNNQVQMSTIVGNGFTLPSSLNPLQTPVAGGAQPAS